MTRARSSRNARASANRARQAAARRGSAANRTRDEVVEDDLEDDLLDADDTVEGSTADTAGPDDAADVDLDEDAEDELPRLGRSRRRGADSTSTTAVARPQRTRRDRAPKTRSDDKSLRPVSRSTKRDTGGGFFLLRFIRFLLRYLREIVSELRKVIWPTRQEMTTYTIVVIVFVVVLVAFVAGLDVGFAKVVLWMFG